MADYTKMKNDELVTLLKERGLPHNGRKAEMVARLQEADKAGDSTTAKADQRTSPVASTKAKTTSKTDQPEASSPALDNGVEKSDAVEATSEAKAEAADGAAADDEPDTTEEAKPAPSFSANLATTSLDEEIARRKKRAEKFGTSEEESDAIRNLERQKRFGTGPDEIADKEQEKGGVSRLDEALPERRQRGAKRGHDESTAGNYEDPGLKRRRGGIFRGKRRERRGNARGGRGDASSGTRNWMTDADRAAAEKRKAKFGA